MTAWVALLKGVNVGSAKRMKMETLRTVFADLRLENIQTYLQSGNVVFRSPESDPLALSARIEAAIERTFGFHSDVILRTAAQMSQVVSNNPFMEEAAADPAKLLVLFANQPPDPVAMDGVTKLWAGSEQIRATATEVFVYYPDGMGRSKLTGTWMEKSVKRSLTGRNWNTVSSLARLLDSL